MYVQMKILKFNPLNLLRQKRRQKITQLSFSELRIAQNKSYTKKFTPLINFLAYIPKYYVKKYKKLVVLLFWFAGAGVALIFKAKNFITIKLIWGRGKLTKPILHIGTLLFICIVFLTGDVFQKDLIVLSREEQEVFVSSESDIIPQTIVLQTSAGSKLRDTVTTYTVKSGDTLSSIGQRFGVTNGTIRYANNMGESDFLRVGQELSIPPVSGIVYKVARGDTIKTIATKFAVSEQAVADFNYLAAPFTLTEGQELILPDAKIPQPVVAYNPQPGINPPGGYDTSAYGFIPNAGGGNRGSGQFVWPTTSRYISQYFSWYHPAIDIAVPGPIFAADAGVVVRSGWWAGGYGFAIQIDHNNGFVTTYAHMSRLDVSVGDSVDRGQTIGQMGSTGRSTGPHVHFTIQKNGQYLNPLEFY